MTSRAHPRHSRFIDFRAWVFALESKAARRRLRRFPLTPGRDRIRNSRFPSSGLQSPILLTLFLIAALVAGRVTAATLGFSTYLGGAEYEGAYAVAVDPAGNVYVGGSTESAGTFPLLDPFQPDYGGGDADAFIAKFNPEGQLIFSTYFGGAGYDAVNDLAVDRDGNLLVVGETRSVDLPSTPDALQPDYGGGSAFGHGDGFIARFSPDGQNLLYCSYFGGSGDERISSVTVAGNGDVSLTGHTDSRNFPLENALQSTYGGGASDGFIAKFGSSLSELLFSTYIGGNHRDEDLQIAVDPAGLIYVGGQTLSTNFPVTPGAFQTEHLVVPEIGDNWDGFVAKLAADGSALLYSTYLGGSWQDWGYRLAVHPQGGVLVVGQTWSLNYPTVNAFQSTNATTGSFGNPADAIITRITPAIEAPTLRIARSGSNVLITWPTHFSGFALQSRATLSPPTDWQPVTASPIVLGGQFTVVQPVADTSQLFRLQQP